MRFVPLKDRFWNRVAKSPGCWIWMGYKDSKGYGCVGEERSRKTTRVHRVSWRLTHGEIPQGMLVCHKCDNPSCVNPDHLFLGTYLDNTRDCIQKGRARKCFGENKPEAKLNDYKVRTAKTLFATGEWTFAELGRAWRVHYSTVRDAVLGKNWKHVK